MPARASIFLLNAIAYRASATQCSSACSTEFVTRCWPYQCGQASTTSGSVAYNTCRSQLGSGPLSMCTAGCTDTTDMAAKQSATCSASSPGPGGSQGGSSGSSTCTTVPASKPSVPTLCTAQNQGCVTCGTGSTQTYVFWPGAGTQQYCFHVYNLPGNVPSTPQPVMLEMSGYTRAAPGPTNMGDAGTAASYYGYTLIQLGSLLSDGASGFGLQFPNDEIVNDANPVPCSSSYSRDMPYLEAVFQFIADRPTLLDATKVYTTGFSQNSMFSIYVAVCFADKVAGTWQGGSGMAKTAHTPLVGFHSNCARSSNAAHGNACCTNAYCNTCKYWPIYPRTCANKIVDCLAAYTDDALACGSDWYMYEAMVAEGNDARLLSFSPDSAAGTGGHSNPKNEWAWIVGCLGMVSPCTSTCATSFSTCISTATGSSNHAKFTTCETQLKAGSLSGCTVGCAPTLAMLQQSESPVVSLSQGRFGQQTGLTTATNPAPKPTCSSGAIGPFTTVGTPATCTPPSTFTLTASNPTACSSLPVPPASRGPLSTTTTMANSTGTSKTPTTSGSSSAGAKRMVGLIAGVGIAVAGSIIIP